ncbi:exonuclease subunit SbcD [Nitrincola alkalilacustris]|uniref:exonuclease subunit SbcD n=1 Tax=Nitrincola alkalilacustris TaxID=1571224 RepID=UPI00124EB016|nr:exonuclease subunit SbcD [Nitrincola alkalilacustris]
MRLLHTSDWHLGQHFFGKSRQPEHQAFLDWLIKQVIEHQVDLVLVAGDIFDTASPPSYAREMYNRFVVALQSTGAQLVVVGGNHDSVAMLHESKALLACLNTHVLPGLAQPEEHLLLVPDRDGEPGLLLCALPFMRPRELITSHAGEGSAEKQQTLGLAIRDKYQQIWELAQARRVSLGRELPIIATGHLTVMGATLTESVREIYIGTLDALPADAFPPVDYLALGHIHKPQQVAGQAHLRYCGSPIALSFDEVKQEKEVLLVEFDTTALQQVSALKVPRWRPMVSVKGDLEQIASQLQEAAAMGTEACPVWVEVTVRADSYLNDLQERIQTLTQGVPLEVLRIRRERSQAVSGLAVQLRETLAELTPEEVFMRRLEQEDMNEEQRQSLLLMYRQLLEQIAHEEGSEPQGEQQA